MSGRLHIRPVRESRRGFNIKNIGAGLVADDKMLRRFQRKYDRFARMRSTVIEAALNVENLLTVLILHFLVGTDYRLHGLLREFIFEAELCTFMHKRRMLSLIFELYPEQVNCLPPEEAKKLRRDLNEVILDRDMFAHGRIFIDGRTEEVSIEYYRGGKRETKVTPHSLSTFLQRCAYVEEKLGEVNAFLRDRKPSQGKKPNMSAGADNPTPPHKASSSLTAAHPKR